MLGTEAKGRSVPVLLKLLRDDDNDVRQTAMIGLRKFDPLDTAHLPTLKELLRDKRAEVRAYAATALGQIGPAAKDAGADLVAVLQDPVVEVRAAAAAVLSKLGSAVKDSVPSLIKQLREGDKENRPRIIAILGAIGPDAAEAVPNLIALMYDDQIGVPAVVAKMPSGQTQKDDIGSVATFTKFLMDLEVAQALVRIRKPAVGSLGKMLRDTNPNMRLATILLLGSIGPEAQDTVLALELRAKSDKVPQIRTAAAAALAKVRAK